MARLASRPPPGIVWTFFAVRFVDQLDAELRASVAKVPYQFFASVCGEVVREPTPHNFGPTEGAPPWAGGPCAMPPCSVMPPYGTAPHPMMHAGLPAFQGPLHRDQTSPHPVMSLQHAGLPAPQRMHEQHHAAPQHQQLIPPHHPMMPQVQYVAPGNLPFPSQQPQFPLPHMVAPGRAAAS